MSNSWKRKNDATMFVDFTPAKQYDLIFAIEKNCRHETAAGGRKCLTVTKWFYFMIVFPHMFQEKRFEP